ncbi:hypothetical protein FPV67DRAFT_1552567 [Lyophyllum atratum]|nr:hypothetical protein FPV67DRAFT_1552567 [Lyophyllum atratum]
MVWKGGRAWYVLCCCCCSCVFWKVGSGLECMTVHEWFEADWVSCMIHFSGVMFGHYSLSGMTLKLSFMLTRVCLNPKP